MSEILKRKLKHKFSITGENSNNIVFVIFVLSLIFFLTTQLYINSILSPLGGKLQFLNSEKDLLVQENRELEKDLANSQSLAVVQKLTNKKYRLKPTTPTQLVYVTGNVNALK